VRNTYHFNVNFQPASFDLLFTFTALSGQVGGGLIPEFPSLPDNWIIEWENMVDLGGVFDKARQLDTTLAEPAMFNLQNEKGQVFGTPEDETNSPENKARLAVRNLLRGYLLRLPTGQAVAQALGITPLTKAEIEGLASSVSTAQRKAVDDGGFAERTPLWYYILAEAKVKGNGKRLGPVGSTIVAGVLTELIRHSEDSILTDPTWSGPTLPTLPGTPAGEFTLRDLLGVAGMLGDAALSCLYTVVSGDTLSGIAQKVYGDASLWPRIFQANRNQIDNPDVILPGQKLRIFGRDRHTVVSGDSLSGIAQQVYGSASLWPRILEVNRDQISNPDVIVPGQVLCIP
jgi:nucleoid-associated protein YgaU